MSRLADLATKKFTTKDFEEALQRNLDKKKAKDKPVEEELDFQPVTEDKLDFQPTEESTFPEAKRTGFFESSAYKAVEPVINFLNEPLSGGYVGRKAREVEAAIPQHEIIKHTGGKDKLQDFIAEVVASGQGFARGAREGAGDVADMFTTPSTFLSLLGGAGASGLAAKGLKGAKTLSNLTRALEATQIPHGGKIALNPKESTINRIFGTLEAAGGAAGSYLGNLPEGPKPTPKPKVEPTGLVDKALAKTAAQPEFKKAAPQTEGNIKFSTKAEMDAATAESPLAKASSDELEGLIYHEDPAVQEAAAAELIRREQPETTNLEPAAEVPLKETPEQMTARLFPGMTRGKSNFNVSPESTAPVSHPPLPADLAGAKPRYRDQTPQFESDLDKALFIIAQDKPSKHNARYLKYVMDALGVDEQTAIKAARKLKGNLKGQDFNNPIKKAFTNVADFLRDEKGEIDLSKLFQGEEDLGYNVRTNDPDAIDIGEVNRPEIDLNQEALRAGEETAKPVNPIRRFLTDESGEFNPDFMNEPGTQEFSPDLVQQADEAFGGQSPRFTPRIPMAEQPQSSFSQRLLNTLQDESGNVPRDPQFGRGGVADFEKDTRRLITPEDRPDIERWYQLKDKHNKLGDNMPEEDMIEWAHLYNKFKGTKGPSVFEVSPWKNEKLPSDEPRKLTYILPDGRRIALSEDLTKGAATTTFQMKGGEIVEAKLAPEGTSSFGNPQSAFSQRLRDTLADESGSVPRLVKPGGERVVPKKYDMQGRLIEEPLTEDAQIAKLTDEAMQAVGREREASLKAGETELTPEELASFREKMQSGEKFAEEVRPETPLLRSKNYLKGLLKDEKGELDLSSLFGKQPENESPIPLLPGKEDLQSGVPITERAAPKLRKESLFDKVTGAPKQAMSMDLPFMTSAAFRQAKPLAWTPDWFKAWSKAAKAYGDKAAYEVMQKEWDNSKYFKPRYKPKYDAKGEVIGYKEVPSPAEEIGVDLIGGKLSPSEEQFGSSAVRKYLPWGGLIERSDRAFRAFINHLRVTQTETLLDQLKWTGSENDMVVGKALGEFINNATGKGSLKWAGPGGRELNLQRAMPVLQKTMWSPQLFAANTKFLNPFSYTSLPAQVRTQYLNGALRMAGTWVAFAGLAKMAGAEVNLDPTNSDFGKIKVGNMRIDPAGGLQQIAVFLAREAPQKVGELGGFKTGRFTSSSTNKTREYDTGAFPIDRASVAEDFATSKLAPVQKLAYDIMRSSSKRPVHLGDRAVQMALPIMAQDIMDAMKEDPSLERLIGSSLGSSVGLGVNTYGKGERISDPVFTNSIEQFLGQPQGSMRGTISKW